MTTIDRPLASDSEAVLPGDIATLIGRELAPHFGALSTCRSTNELHALALYQELASRIHQALATPAVGSFATTIPAAKPRYRCVAWNLERGIHLPGQLVALREHPYLRESDLLLLTETDSGMARSGNHDVARELAAGLGMHYAFLPCYLNLSKGAGQESEVDGRNRLGLHGNALLSRYPIRNVRRIALVNGIDKMAGREKRLGTQTALAAEVAFPDAPLTVAVVHLDAQSTQEHRRQQLGDVLRALPASGPVLVGGDWNTTTYNSSHAFYAIMGFALRVLIGVERTITRHYLHPQNHFERRLFQHLEGQGFDYRGCNVIGEPTFAYDIADLKARKNLGEWVPGWCFAFIRWALRNHGGQCPLKLDWFATRGLTSVSPTVIHELRAEDGGPQLSDHDPIGIEVAIPR
ncbi:MAG TPA: endonuclease/exonuclease/phosphatase family protein [Candidatus Udaeobacter sp.]|nr:endonuclease/exonuclease/phosphatase family protein [Candidatus Udaeobacter sp.]